MSEHDLTSGTKSRKRRLSPRRRRAGASTLIAHLSEEQHAPEKLRVAQFPRRANGESIYGSTAPGYTPRAASSL
jgi:hypothetical protein